MSRTTRHRNIVLTGFMGTGKTTTGRLLAERLEMAFVDTDELIEHRHGPIAHIFRDQGEQAFRSIERAIADELARRTGLVIATGGRMLLDADSARALTRTGRVFCLVADTDEILARVLGDTAHRERPLLSGPDARQAIVDLLAERATGYARYEPVDTSDRSPSDVADTIASLVGSG